MPEMTMAPAALLVETRSMRGAFVVFAGVLVSSGCFFPDDPEPVIPEGEHYQYVISRIYIPETNTQAREYSVDLNNDKSGDNQLGTIFSLLHNQGFSVSSTVAESLLRGHAIMLGSLQTVAFDSTRASGFRTSLGENPQPSACADPTMLMTCGRHLATEAHYDLVLNSDSLLGVAGFEDGRLEVPVGSMRIAIGIDPAAPLRLELRDARVKLSNMTPTSGAAIIGGAIAESDLDTVVIPEVARNLARIVRDECGVQSQPGPCGCPNNERANLIQAVFDGNDDCTIDMQEVASNDLVQSLFSPELTIEGEQYLSFGIGAELAPATF